jgi:AcrR family transcriptional regulator
VKVGPMSTKRLTGAERRAQLLDVGRGVFAERAFELASMDDIAQRAGISKPIVYEHFGSKEGLYAAIVEREMEELVTRVSSALSTGSSRRRWEGAVVAFVNYIEARPAGFEVLTREAPSGVGRRGLTRVIDQLAERVGDVLGTAFQRAGVSPRLAPLYATALLGMVTQVGQWWAEGGRKVPRDEVVRHVAALGWMGLRHLPTNPAHIVSFASKRRETTGKRPRKPRAKAS